MMKNNSSQEARDLLVAMKTYQYIRSYADKKPNGSVKSLLHSASVRYGLVRREYMIKHKAREMFKEALTFD